MDQASGPPEGGITGTHTPGGGAVTPHALRIVIVLGLVVSLMSGVGLFAVFTDRATTDPNTADSGEIARAADVALTTADLSLGGTGCGDSWFEDLQLPLVAASNLQPSDEPQQSRDFCLLNAGSSSVDVLVSAIDLVDSEIGCTGDEATVDASCGLGDPGELSPLLRVNLVKWDCDAVFELGTGANLGMISNTLPGLVASGMPFQGGSTLAPGAMFCASMQILYPTGATAEQVQAAQSDRATWRFAFDATAP